jgi:hypothetical protein
MFNVKILNKVEGKEQYRVEISNRFATLENLDDVNINRARKTARENIKISAKKSLSYYELKKHKTWFDEGCEKIIRPKETSQIAVDTGSKRKNWG